MDEQRIARTASIIGTTFTADVLNNALPKQLRPYMTIILHSLVDTHWLNANSEQNPNGMITVEYSFSHPLLHKTLYDLTPSSVKSKIHLSIAKYIEKIYFEDKLYFMSLGYRKSFFSFPFCYLISFLRMIFSIIFSCICFNVILHFRGYRLIATYFLF